MNNSQVQTGRIRVDLLASEALPNGPFDRNEVMFVVSQTYFTPQNIWELDSAAGRIMRSVAYGKPDLARPTQDFSRLAPNIAHIIWTNKDPMSFTFYLCVLSLLDVAKVDRVFIHGDGPPSGQYWDLIKDHSSLRLVRRTLFHKRFEYIYGQKVKNMAHVTDLWRLDILHRFGGLYVDTDAIFFRPLTREIRAYDAVMSPDVYSYGDLGDWPNDVQNGVMLGKPRAEFWLRFLQSMKIYHDNRWVWNSGKQPYRIKELHPELLHIESHFNTICFQGKCYPSWTPEFRGGMDHIKTGDLEHWRGVTFAIHHTWPNVRELESPRELLLNNGSTIFGEVGLYVLEQTNKLDIFKKMSKKVCKSLLCYMLKFHRGDY